MEIVTTKTLILFLLHPNKERRNFTTKWIFARNAILPNRRIFVRRPPTDWRRKDPFSLVRFVLNIFQQIRLFCCSFLPKFSSSQSTSSRSPSALFALQVSLSKMLAAGKESVTVDTLTILSLCKKHNGLIQQILQQLGKEDGTEVGFCL